MALVQAGCRSLGRRCSLFRQTHGPGRLCRPGHEPFPWHAGCLTCQPERAGVGTWTVARVRCGYAGQESHASRQV